MRVVALQLVEATFQLQNRTFKKPIHGTNIHHGIDICDLLANWGILKTTQPELIGLEGWFEKGILQGTKH